MLDSLNTPSVALTRLAFTRSASANRRARGVRSARMGELRLAALEIHRRDHGDRARRRHRPICSINPPLYGSRPGSARPAEGENAGRRCDCCRVAASLAAIDSQIAIIRSTVFLRRVVERAHLVPAASAAAGPAPAPDEEGLFGAVRGFVLGLIGSWRGEITSRNRAEPAAPVFGGDAIPAAELRAIEALRESLQVARAPQRGYMLTIAVTSPDPAEAARLANAVAETYLVDKLDARLEAAKRASAWLGDRLVGLRAQLRESEEAVAQFRAEHRLMQSGGATLSQQQLSELNLTLIQARADLAQKKARVDLLGSIQAKGGSIADMPDIAKAGTLRNPAQGSGQYLGPGSRSAGAVQPLAPACRQHPRAASGCRTLDRLGDRAARRRYPQRIRIGAGARRLARTEFAAGHRPEQQGRRNGGSSAGTGAHGGGQQDAVRGFSQTGESHRGAIDLRAARCPDHHAGACPGHAELSEQDALHRCHAAGRAVFRGWRRVCQGQAQFRIYDAEDRSRNSWVCRCWHRWAA